ncbi:glycosyltransferase family 4 protein [Persicitalea sp.]|uniref:glycosyltransferase family 4 protein n=1 Tax=Persicitalea sp. TaxID=3100273 RepID=UPI003592F7C1
MKIAVWHNLPYGGGARALNYQLNGLLDRGHCLEVWSPNPLADGIIQLPQQVPIHLVSLKRTAHIPYADRISAAFFGKDVNIREMELHCLLCAQEINKGGFDLLFANCCFYFAAPFISRFVSIPTVLYLGEPRRFFYEAHPKSFWESPGELNKLSKTNLRFCWEWLKDLWKTNSARVQVREERLNIDAVDKLLVNSIFSSESCARAYDQSGEVCYLGVDTSLFRPLKEKRIQNYVVGLGSLFFHKGAELAIQSIACIPTQDRPALIWVSNITDPIYKYRMQELAGTLAVDFIVKEIVSDETLVGLLNNAICLLYTSKLEPFGFAPLEANACATPVIGLMQGGTRETVLDGRTGFLTPPDKLAIADKLKYFIDNPDVREGMGRLGLANVRKNWSLEAATFRLERAMESTVKPTTIPLTPASESTPPVRRKLLTALPD